MRNLRICFNCSEFNLVTKDNHLVCRSCHYSIPLASYKDCLSQGKKAVYFGYLYRAHYEKQSGKSFKSCPSLLEPSSMLELLGVVVLTSILGGASYDLVKKISSKIWGKISAHKNLDPEIIEIFEKGNFEIFYKYIKEYCEESSDVHKEVRDSIDEEYFISVYVERLTRVKHFPKCNTEDYIKAFKDAKNEITSKSKLPPKNMFKKFWRKMK